VVCRHEQNASFIAAGLGKLTGKTGVCLVTSGPGSTNLVTGFATANSEGMPVVGLGGAVPRAQRLKQAHQSLDTVILFKPVTKYSAEVDAPAAIGEILAAAFRAAESGRPGAAFISLPMDIMTGAAPNLVLAPVRPQELGAGPPEAIVDAVQPINQAKVPVLLLGMQASEPANATAVRALLEKVSLPCVCTYQGAGIVPRSMIHFGPVDTVKYAEAFGAKGFAIKSPDEFAPTLRKAMDMAGPVLIDIPVDYSHNLELGEQMHPDVIV
jgi:acetolactate synthase I/II/III large subunit